MLTSQKVLESELHLNTINAKAIGGEINAPLYDILRRKWNQVCRSLVTN